MTAVLEGATTLTEAVEQVRAQHAGPDWINAGNGKQVGHRRPGGLNEQQFTEAMTFLSEITSGKRRGDDIYLLAEAMTTDDFTNLFGDIIDRVLLGNYQATPTTFRNYMKIGSVRDFRTVKRLFVDGAMAPLSAVQQQAPYPDAKLVDGAYTYFVQKYGRVVPFSWETMVNDDLGALQDTASRLGIAAARTEEQFATKLFASSTGPNSTYFTSGHANLLSGHPILDQAGLESAWTSLATQTDTEGYPIIIQAAHLVVPPQLFRQAQYLLTATEIWYNQAPGSTNAQVHLPNPWKGYVTLHENAFLPLVDTTKGTTAWYLFADPNLSRPAAEVGFLRGHETPEVFMRSPDAVRVGGGLTDPMDGDFMNDSMSYKIRHVIGGTLLDTRAAVASAGA